MAVRDVAFGGKMADEEHFPVVREIIVNGADDDAIRPVFDPDVVVQIGNV
jgi:hypothetical protein